MKTNTVRLEEIAKQVMAEINPRPQIIREFKTRNFTVRVDALEDYDVDPSFDEDGSVRKGLENGDLICFCAHAVAYCKGSEVASDYLGGCIYKSIEEFADHIECGKYNRMMARDGKKGQCGSYFRDMIRTVCDEARKTLCTMQSVRVRI
jgi:hypothetical protein